MAAGGSDGSLRFDTAINIDGFEDGISTFKGNGPVDEGRGPVIHQHPEPI